MEQYDQVFFKHSGKTKVSSSSVQKVDFSYAESIGHSAAEELNSARRRKKSNLSSHRPDHLATPPPLSVRDLQNTLLTDLSGRKTL